MVWGRIQELNIKKRGIFTQEQSLVTCISNALGNEALIEVVFRPIGKKSQEFCVQNVVLNEGKTHIEINNALSFKEVKDLTLFFSKSILTITNTIEEESKLLSYSLVTDFTPNLSLPLLSNKTLQAEPFINKSFLLLDAKIKELEARIRWLENPPI